MKILATLCLLPAMAAAVPITGALLNFDGLKSGEQVLDYYSGGFGSLGSGGGPSFGVSFTSGLAADSTTVAVGPSAVVTAPSVTMNLDSPWSRLLSFYFTGNGSISFFSGPNATGSLLQTFALSYPPFFPFAAGPGSFQSVVFTPAAASTLRLDSISLSSSSVIPEPSAGAMLLVGVTLITGLKRFCR
jgi:hypothetical protein